MYKYRILVAQSGYYYVQRYRLGAWKKIGGFFRTKAGARRFINEMKYGSAYATDSYPRVVEYA